MASQNLAGGGGAGENFVDFGDVRAGDSVAREEDIVFDSIRMGGVNMIIAGGGTSGGLVGGAGAGGDRGGAAEAVGTLPGFATLPRAGAAITGVSLFSEFGDVAAAAAATSGVVASAAAGAVGASASGAVVTNIGSVSGGLMFTGAPYASQPMVDRAARRGRNFLNGTAARVAVRGGGWPPVEEVVAELNERKARVDVLANQLASEAVETRCLDCDLYRMTVEVYRLKSLVERQAVRLRVAGYVVEE